MLDRKYRVVLSYPEWRANGLKLRRDDPLNQPMVLRELELPICEWGNASYITTPYSKLVSAEGKRIFDRLRQDLIERLAHDMFSEGYTPLAGDLIVKYPGLGEDPIIGTSMGVKFWSVFEGRIDQYIANLTKKLKDLDYDFALYKRKIKRRGLLQSVKDWFVWTLNDWFDNKKGAHGAETSIRQT